MRVNTEGKTAKIVLAAVVALWLAGAPIAASAQTDVPEAPRVLYVLPHVNADPYPVTAYVILGETVIEAQTVWVDGQAEPAEGPVGIAVDSANGRVYVAHEHSGLLDTFDALTLERLADTDIDEATDLAGMDIDETTGRFFMADVGSSTVIVYDTDTMTFGESWDLSTDETIYGLSVFGDFLYVGSAAPSVNYFDVNEHTLAGDFDQTNLAIAISAVGAPTPVVYTTNALAGPGVVTSFDVGAGTEDFAELGTVAKGIAAAGDGSLVFALGGEGDLPETGLYVLDGETLDEITMFPHGDGTWSGTDLGVGFNDFGDTVAVTVTDPANRVPAIGETLAAEFTISNNGDEDIALLPASVLFDNALLEFVSATPAPDVSKAEAELTWSDLVTSFGENLAAGESFTVTVGFTAKDPGECINAKASSLVARMAGAEDVNTDPVDDAAGIAGFAVLCPCETDADCDDGNFCTGAGSCNDQGVCEFSGDPCDEGEQCNEQADACEEIPSDDDTADDDDVDGDDDDDDDDDGGCGC
ncbi:MAG: hypothetical protein M5R36_07115 [Deltaproteobacteria bacterium]|nr:hypothetical protein [Deltaproteobacteria bacterium]